MHRNTQLNSAVLLLASAALLFGLAVACDSTASEPSVPVLIPPGQVERLVGVSSSTNAAAGAPASAADSKNKIAVTIYTPAPDESGARMRGNVLVLPGWKYDRRRWLRETPIKRLADKHRLRLICPEMGRSIYASEYYPETGARWNAAKPGLAWILEDLLPYLAEQGVFRKGQQNFLLGLSTGGRGVAQIALARPDLITAASALSGDFDQTLQTGDRLMAGHYGAYARFAERWQTVDNPVSRAAEWQTPLYLSHGKRDRIVPLIHTQTFYDRILAAQTGGDDQAKPAFALELHTPDAGHDFAFWAAESGPSFEFFEKHIDD